METREIVPIKVSLSEEFNDIKLYVLSDLHIGDPNCNIKALEETIKFIKNTPNMYVVCLGDILNTALTMSKSDIYSEVMNVSEAQQYAVNLLYPIKDRILGMVTGNHESRVWREVGVDLSLWLAEKLGIQDKYRLGGIALSIDFGKAQKGRKFKLNIFGQHGSRGGRKLGGSLNALEDMDSIVSNADIYLMGHTHQNIQGGRTIFQFNDRGNIEKQYKYYFNVPSFLKYGGYAYDKGYKPSDDTPCYLNIRAYRETDDKGTKHNRFKIDKICV